MSGGRARFPDPSPPRLLPDFEHYGNQVSIYVIIARGTEVVVVAVARTLAVAASVGSVWAWATRLVPLSHRHLTSGTSCALQLGPLTVPSPELGKPMPSG